MKAKSTTRDSTLERFIKLLGVSYSTLAIIWNTNTITVKRRLRHPLELTYDNLLSLSGLLQIPVVVLFGLIQSSEQRGNPFNMAVNNLNTFYVNYEVFHSPIIDIRIFKGGKQIDLQAMYERIATQHTNKMNKAKKNNNLLLRYSNQAKQFDRLSDQVLIFKATGTNQPQNGETP